jgi:thymidylate kinase
MTHARTAFTVTFIGADGAGKTTVTRHLLETLPYSCRYLYMGVSASSSNRMLPTTRLYNLAKLKSGRSLDTGGPPDPERVSARPRSATARVLKSLRGWLHVIVLISEEWYRQILAWFYLARGHIVIQDRHFFIDYYAYDITRPLTLAQRIHGWMLLRVYPRPQLVLFLDAPADLLFARKGEGSVELLERRRQDYLALRDRLPHFAVVDASQPLADVKTEVEELISHYSEHGGLPDGR